MHPFDDKWCTVVKKRDKWESRSSRKRLTITLPEADITLLDALAKEKRVSLAWVVREAVRGYLDASAPLLKER